MALENKVVVLNGLEFVLGKKYRDTILGTEGIATGGATYLTGGDRIQLAMLKPSGEPDYSWYDATQVELVD